MGLCPHPSIALAFASFLVLLFELGVFSLSSQTRAFNHEHNVIAIPPLSLIVSTGWVPANWEETLAVQGKFRRFGWRAPNYKPKMTKIVA
jgi:hypothetical protein